MSTRTKKPTRPAPPKPLCCQCGSDRVRYTRERKHYCSKCFTLLDIELPPYDPTLRYPPEIRTPEQCETYRESLRAKKRGKR